jgi:hypothetical protein
MSPKKQDSASGKVTSVIGGVRYVGSYAVEGRKVVVRSRKMELSAALPDEATAPEHVARHLLRLLVPRARSHIQR